MAVDDSYTYPDSNGVLINEFGINDAEELASVVDTITKYRTVTAFDIARTHTGFERLRLVHEHLFQDIFAWAGRLRTTNTANGALVHCLAPYLEENIEIFEPRR